jgi:hypothetical protein
MDISGLAAINTGPAFAGKAAKGKGSADMIADGAGMARRLSLALLIVMLVASPLFVWLLFRPGYSAEIRTAGSVYAATMLALGIFRTLSL